MSGKDLKVRVIARRTLREFWEKHPDSEEPLKAWFHETEKASWINFNELKADYPSASILKGKKVIFNIKGNKYRLVVKMNFDFGITWILFIGTHAEYDKLDINNL